MHGGIAQSGKLVFGGQGPRPMRHEPWVVNQHPLGPSTDTAQENCFQNPYDAAVGAAIMSRVTWYTPVQGHGIQLTALQWNDE